MLGRPLFPFKLWCASIHCKSVIFYTDDEMLIRTGRVINVQSVVEQPEIHFIAHCGDTIAEKLAYVNFRREDILQMKTPLSVGIEVYDTMRFFQGRN